MTNTAINEANEVAEQIAHYTKRVTMCEAAQPHLKGCARSQNTARIAEAREMLGTLTYHAEVLRRLAE